VIVDGFPQASIKEKIYCLLTREIPQMETASDGQRPLKKHQMQNGLRYLIASTSNPNFCLVGVGFQPHC